MKWYFWVIIGILALIVIGYFTNWFGMGKKKTNGTNTRNVDREVAVTMCGAFNTLAPPPDGKRYACIIKAGKTQANWELIEAGQGWEV